MKKCQKYLDLPDVSLKNELVIHASRLKLENRCFTSRLHFFLDFVARRSKK